VAAKIIGINNQKGGVGKTTSASNIGRGLARKGNKVALIDLDPQGNLFKAVFPAYPHEPIEGVEIEMPEGIRPGFHNSYLLFGEKNNAKPLVVEEDGYEFDLYPATEHLAEINDRDFQKVIFAFKKNVEELAKKYDYIIIDSVPSLGNLQVAVHVVADYILIPVEYESWSIKGVEKLINVLLQVKDQLNPKLELLGIFACKVSTQATNVEYTWKAQLQELYPDHLLADCDITRSVKVIEANSEGKSIFEYDKKCQQAKQYNKLLDTVLERMSVEVGVA